MRRPTKVILLSVDSLRYDRFTREHFPRCWDRFESGFVRFERAIAAGVATPFAMPAILTGTTPAPDGTIDTDRSVAHTFEYAAALTNNPHLGPERGYDSGFDRFSTGPRSSSRTVEGTVSWACDAIDGPGLYWIHIMKPHFPFDVPKRVNDAFIDGTATPAECEQLREAYDDAVRRTDRALARLFDAIPFDESMVILVADHGEAFGEQGVFNHAWDARPIDELVRVPLAVSIPGREGGTKEHLVGTDQVAAAIRERSLSPLERAADAVRSYSNRWTRITEPDGVRFREDSPFDMEELDDSDAGVIERLKALGYR